LDGDLFILILSSAGDDDDDDGEKEKFVVGPPVEISITAVSSRTLS